MAGSPNSNNNPATNAQANAAARAALFTNGFFSSVELPAQTWTDSGSYSFDMPHAGVGLYASVRVTGNLTWTDTNSSPVAPTLGKMAPYNLFASFQFKDYLGNTRINAGGPTLHRRETLQYYQNTSGEAGWTSTASRDYANTNIDNFKLNSSSTVAEAVDFAVVVPFSFHESTTIGTLPFTVPAGNNTLYITLNKLCNSTATANAESPLQANTNYTTTTANLTNAQIQVTYYYIDPVPGQALPLMDFSQVYEIMDVKSTDNLSANATKRVLLPTGRTYQRIYVQLVNAGDLYDTGVNKLQFLINESTPTLAEYYNSYLHRVRRTYGRDLPTGEICWDLYQRPISPSNYGSIAVEVDLNASFSASGETYFNLGKESLYVLQTQVY